MLQEGWTEKYKEALLIEQDLVDVTLGTLSSNIISLAMLLGTLTIAAIPALFTGYSVFILTSSQWSPQMSTFAGWVFGIGLEAVGMVTSNVALKLYRGWREQSVILEEFLITIALMIIYVVATVTVILFVEELPLTLKAVGCGSPFLAVVLYIARGLYLDHVERETRKRLEVKERRIQKRQERIEDRTHQRELEKLRLEYEYKAAQSGNFPATNKKTETLPEWLPKIPASRNEWRQMIKEGVKVPEYINGSELANLLDVSNRSGRNYLQDARQNGYERN